MCIRGHGDETDGNFYQLLKLRGEEDEMVGPYMLFQQEIIIIPFLQILAWLQKKKGKFSSHDMQNELLKVMAISVLRSIVDNIQQADFFTIMVNECADISNQD